MLKGVGFSAVEIAGVLRDPNLYNIQAGLAAAHILKDVSFGVIEVDAALEQVFFVLDVSDFAQILKNVGFSAVEIALDLRDFHGYTHDFNSGRDSFAAARVLKDVSFRAVDVASALKQVFSVDEAFSNEESRSVLPMLYDAGFSNVDIAQALRDVYDMDATATTTALYRAGTMYHVDTVRFVGEALKQVYAISDPKQAAQILKDAGVDIAVTALVLKDSTLYDIQNPMSAGQMLRAASFPADKTMEALVVVYDFYRRPFYIFAHNPNESVASG